MSLEAVIPQDVVAIIAKWRRSVSCCDLYRSKRLDGYTVNVLI